MIISRIISTLLSISLDSYLKPAYINTFRAKKRRRRNGQTMMKSLLEITEDKISRSEVDNFDKSTILLCTKLDFSPYLYYLFIYLFAYSICIMFRVIIS